MRCPNYIQLAHFNWYWRASGEKTYVFRVKWNAAANGLIAMHLQIYTFNLDCFSLSFPLKEKSRNWIDRLQDFPTHTITHGECKINFRRDNLICIDRLVLQIEPCVYVIIEWMKW